MQSAGVFYIRQEGDHADKFIIIGGPAKQPDTQSSSRGRFSGMGLDGTDLLNTFILYHVYFARRVYK